MRARETSSLSLAIVVAAIGIALASPAQTKVQAIGSFPMIDQQPQTRNIIVEWGTHIYTG
jgi:hypothetical protein